MVPVEEDNAVTPSLEKTLAFMSKTTPYTGRIPPISAGHAVSEHSLRSLPPPLQHPPPSPSSASGEAAGAAPSTLSASCEEETIKGLLLTHPHFQPEELRPCTPFHIRGIQCRSKEHGPGERHGPHLHGCHSGGPGRLPSLHGAPRPAPGPGCARARPDIRGSQACAAHLPRMTSAVPPEVSAPCTQLLMKTLDMCERGDLQEEGGFSSSSAMVGCLGTLIVQSLPKQCARPGSWRNLRELPWSASRGSTSFLQDVDLSLWLPRW